MDPRYGACYRELYERHWWWRSRHEVIVDELNALVPHGGFGRILDVGCGDGLLFPTLSRWGEVEGVEPDTRLITDRANEHGRIHPVPFDDSFTPGYEFGLITMLDVIEHLDDPVGALRHAKRLLAPRSWLVVTVPALQALWTRHDELNEHRRRYTRGLLLQQLHQAGLEPMRSRYLFQWLAGAKLATRAVEAFSRGEPGLPDIPPQPINRALIALSTLEARLLDRFNPPFGSSVLAIARPGGDAALPARTPRSHPG